MEKQIIPGTTALRADLLQFSVQKPIKAFYDGACNPIFVIPPSDYRLNASRLYASLRIVRGANSFWDMLSELDRNVPRVAWEQRTNWFPEDLHDNSLEEFTEAYRCNLTNPTKSSKTSYNYNTSSTQVTFNLYLGELRNGNELPVPVFHTIKDTSTSDSTTKTEPLPNALQELAWGSTQGRVTLLVECTGLWTKEESFGLGWRVRQIVYRAEPCLPKGSQSFIDNDSIRRHEWKVAPPPNALSETDKIEDPGPGTSLSLTNTDSRKTNDADSAVTPPYNPLLDHED